MSIRGAHLSGRVRRHYEGPTRCPECGGPIGVPPGKATAVPCHRCDVRLMRELIDQADEALKASRLILGSNYRCVG